MCLGHETDDGLIGIELWFPAKDESAAAQDHERQRNYHDEGTFTYVARSRDIQAHRGDN